MQAPYPTIVYRHRRENLKKCSLRGLEKRKDFLFFSYPNQELPDLQGYILLDIEGAPLTREDRERGLLVLDGTWRYAETMKKQVLGRFGSLERRSIPSHYLTAYPRRQEDCMDPTRGLASVEALYIALRILERGIDGLLDGYYWKEPFLQVNKFVE